MSNHITFNHIYPGNQAEIEKAEKTLQETIQRFRGILSNTELYRMQWKSETRDLIASVLQEVIEVAELPSASIQSRENVENLGAVVLDLGRVASGITETLDDSGVLRPMLKSNGSLFYQQLYNGKIIAMMLRPFIEGYGQPQQPLTLEILRPEEMSKAIILRHLDIFFNDLISWEDFDDDAQRANIGFNPIGFNATRDKQQ